MTCFGGLRAKTAHSRGLLAWNESQQRTLSQASSRDGGFMQNAGYYREQARLLLEWARSLRATDPVTATRLSARADSYLVWATAAEIEDPMTAGRPGAVTQ